MDKLEHYLDRVCRSIGGPRSLRQHIRRELREHLLDAAAEHKAAGLSEEEALARALEDFGGPEEVRSELEATHGQRLMAVAIDKAMQWKEKTMRAKWLWTTWTYLAVVGVIVVQVLFFTFAEMFYVPKLRKIQKDGWLDIHDVNSPVLAWLDSSLRGLRWVGDNVTWCVLIVAALWGLFEWRVRSENKSFMRLSALGTIALLLMVAALFIAGALVIPFELGMPAMIQITTPFAGKQMDTIDASVGAMEQAMAKQDWRAIQDHAERAASAVDRLSTVAGAIAAPTLQKGPTVEELRTQLRTANEDLLEARTAAREKDAERLKAALQRFRQSYGPVREAAKRSEP